MRYKEFMYWKGEGKCEFDDFEGLLSAYILLVDIKHSNK